jgi:hypothetical protein
MKFWIPRRVLDQLGHHLPGKLLVDIEAHVRQLEADIDIELATLDFVQQLVIKPGAGHCLLASSDIFAQIIDAGANTEPVHGLCRLDQLFDRRSGDESARHLEPQRRPLRKMTQRLVLR